jgi:hypothetical protein
MESIPSSGAARAPEAVDAILALLGLETCLFTARALGNRCAVRVDYVTQEGWKTATFCLGSEVLYASLEDASLQQQLADVWQSRLQGARAISPKQAGRQFTHVTRH